jgi:hypothetical protein
MKVTINTRKIKSFANLQAYESYINKLFLLCYFDNSEYQNYIDIIENIRLKLFFDHAK